MTKFTDDTPIAMLTVGQLKEILGIDRILGNLTANQAPAEQVMTIEEVVRLTGYSKATIYKFTSERKIPFRKPEHGGRRLYFQREEILDWLQSESHPTIEQYCNNHIKQCNGRRIERNSGRGGCEAAKEETERGLCIPHLILRSYRTYAWTSSA